MLSRITRHLCGRWCTTSSRARAWLLVAGVLALGGLWLIFRLPARPAPIRRELPAAPWRTAANVESPRAVAVADFNGDGKRDLAVAAMGSARTSAGVTIFLGLGGASFQFAHQYHLDGPPQDLVVADFNRDGKLDVAVATAGPEHIRDGVVSVLLGNGDGSFDRDTDTAIGDGTDFISGLHAADFDGDGKVDLAAVSEGGARRPLVNIVRGNGDGAFKCIGKCSIAYSGPYHRRSVVVCDCNGDGKTDLVATNYDRGTLSVMLGRGDGTFRNAVDFPCGGHPTCVAAGDLNDDGKVDLVCGNHCDDAVAVDDGTCMAEFGNKVSVLFGSGDGTFRLDKSYDVDLLPFFAATGRFGGKGCGVVVLSGVDSVRGIPPSVGALGIFRGGPEGTLLERVSTSLERPYMSGNIVVADLDGDGLDDLVVARPLQNTVQVLLSETGRAATIPAIGHTPSWR